MANELLYGSGNAANVFDSSRVEDYFIERYTTWILLEPPVEGSNWLIYAAPAVAVLLGLVVVATRRKRSQVPVAVRSDAADAWRQKVLDELD